MKEHAPLVSIGLPVLNGERYLREAIDSILAQSFEDFELIISDNGSTDSTQSICEWYAGRDHRIRYYRHDINRGAAWNYNEVFRHSRGKYFKWASHDDLCAPTFLERCVKVLEIDARVVLCTPRTTVIDAEGKKVEDYPYEFGIRGVQPHERYSLFHHLYAEPDFCNPIFGVFRSDILRTTPLIEGFVCSDRVLVGEVALHGDVVELPEYLFFYRDHANLSWKASAHLGQTLSWYDPRNKRKYVFQYWVILLKHLNQVHRVDMPFRERFLCIPPLVRWMFSHLGFFTKELIKPLIRWYALRPIVLRALARMGVGGIREEHVNTMPHYVAPRRMLSAGARRPV